MGELKCSNCNHKNQYPDGAPEWMTTYSDMVTLLLTFFVLMLAMATFDPIKFTSVSEAFSKSFGMMPSFDSPIKRKRQKQPLREQYNTEEERMRGIGYRMKKSFPKDTIDTDMTKEGLRITLKSKNDIRFDSGGAELSPGMEKVLLKLGNELKGINKRINIAGHTDKDQVVGGKYKDNWDLSYARAKAVQDFLTSKGTEDGDAFLKKNMTSISAYAETRPISSEKDEENRRIEIFIERSFGKPRGLSD